MEFVKPLKIEAVYKITTPMYLGGADEQADKNVFRVASFKGALRFWWRALNWGRCFQQANKNESLGLSLLHAEEANLFGSATADNQGSQGVFNINIEAVNLSIAEKSKEMLPEEKSYLLGMGLFHFRDGVLRSRIKPGAQITVSLFLKNRISPEQKNQLLDALQALGYFGALGARARRGYGSIAIQSLTLGSEKISVDNLNALKAFVAKLNTSAPADAPLSAFTSKTRIDISLKGNSSATIMGQLNDSLQLYRSFGFGNNKQVNGQNALQLFRDDHDNVLYAIRGQPLKQLPRRAIFGLPHNYRYSSGGDASIAPSVKKIERRASPLLTHIHEFSDGQCLAIQTFLTSRFLPVGTTIEVKTRLSNKSISETLTNLAVDTNVIHDYLDFNKFFSAREELLRDK